MKRRGLPRVAWVIIAVVALAGTSLAVIAYLGTRQWLAPAILFGVTWLFVLAAAQMGDMVITQRQRE